MDKTCLQCLGLLESPSVPGGEECSCTVSSVLGLDPGLARDTPSDGLRCSHCGEDGNAPVGTTSKGVKAELWTPQTSQGLRHRATEGHTMLWWPARRIPRWVAVMDGTR